MFGNNIRRRYRSRKRAGPRRDPWRRENGLTVVAVVLLAAAVVGWSQPDLRLGGLVDWPGGAGRGVTPVRDLVLRPSAAGEGPKLVVLRPAVGASDVFRLCAEHRQPNCVVDGDTIWHRGVKIRLADVDTPEIYSPECAAEAALGRQATERLLELINAGPFEVVPSGSRDADRYGRKLRILERDGRSLGHILIAEGLARPWDGARRSWCG